MPEDEWELLRSRLGAASVTGSDELGRFVSNTEFFEPSQFDERTAYPILLNALPTLSDPGLVSAVAGHLRRPWLKGEAFPVLRGAFLRWVPVDQTTAWHLGDALASASTKTVVPQLVGLVRDQRNGMARQMLVSALGRFKSSDDALSAATDLSTDDDVALHALRALRKLAGAEVALKRATEVATERPGTRAAEQAEREARKLRRSLTTRS